MMLLPFKKRVAILHYPARNGKAGLAMPADFRQNGFLFRSLPSNRLHSPPGSISWL